MNAIDLNYLENMTGRDNEVMIEVINLLIEETPKHLNNIKKAQDDEN
jgi:HPt (histidine-containing phosphotransfer) domain-containing protein